MEPFYGKANIDSISVKGLMVIKFNESMQVPSNISHFNQSTIDMFVKVSDARRFETDFNASKLNFTWHVVEFTERNMTVQINFENPLLISPKIE